MYVIGNGDTVYQYTLSTAWDLSTASYDSVSFSVNSQDATTTALFFKPDGSKMYVLGDSNNSVYQFSTGSPIAATATYPASFKFPAGTAPTVPADGILDILQAQTTDGGTTWNVRQLGADFS